MAQPPRSILVTGASGFVGRYLLPALATAFPGARLIPTSRRAGATVDDVAALQLDLESPDDVRSLLKSEQPDAVIHLSGIASPRLANDDPAVTRRANVGQALTLAEAIREHAPNAFFAFISSASVYGASAMSGEPLDEDAPLQPADIYGRTKAEADQAIGDIAKRGLKAVRLRPFNHTGPGQSAEYLVPTLARQIALIERGKADGNIVRVMSRQSARDYLDVRDVCAAYVEAVRHRDALEPGIALNVASGRARSVEEIFEALRKLARTDIALVDEGRSGGIPVMRGDASRAKKLLGWQATIPFERTLAEMLDWWRDAAGRED